MVISISYETDAIKKLLADYPQGFMLKDISKHLVINRVSLSKYLATMVARGEIEYRSLGKAKLYTLTKRIALENILGQTEDHIIITDNDHRVTQIEERTAALFCIPVKMMIGKMLPGEGSNCRFFSSDGTPLSAQQITKIESGEFLLDCGDHITCFQVKNIPVVLNDSSRGNACILTDITEKKEVESELRVEKEMRETEKQFRCIFDQAPIGAAIISLDNRYISVNEMLCSITGYTPEELTGFVNMENTHPDDRSAYEEKMRNLIAGEIEVYNHDIRYIRKDGSIVLVHVSVRLLKDGTGKTTLYFLSMMEDITERKRVEELLRESEERFRDLFNTVTSGVAIYEVHGDGATGKDYIIQDFNKKALELEGKTKDEVIGKSLYDLRPTIDEYGLIPVFQRVWKTGVPELYPQKIYVDEKYASWYENRVLRLQSGEVVAVYNDVTDRKRAEMEIARLASFPQLNPAMIFEIDPVEQVLFVNPAMQSTMSRLGLLSPLMFIPEDVHQLIREWDTRTRANYDRECSVAGRHFLVTIYLSPEYRSIRFYFSDITKRKRTEEALRESEEKYRLLSECSPDHVIVQDLDLRYIYILNPQLGLKPEDMLGRTDYDFLEKEDADKLTHIKREVIRTGTAAKYETFLMSGTGEKEYFEGTYVPKYDKEGKIDGLMGYFRNVTDRKLAEVALQESGEKQRNFFMNSIEGVFWSTPEGRFISANPAAARMLGYDSPEELISAVEDIGVQVYIDPDDRIRLTSLLKKGGVIKNLEVKCRHKNGNSIWGMLNVHVVRDVQGNIVFFEGTCQDITERKKIEEVLRESEEKYRHLVEMMNEGLLAVDNNCNITFVNNRYCEIVGYLRDELIGKPSAMLLAPECTDVAQDQWAMRMRGNSDSYPIRLIRRDGQHVNARAAARPIYDENGQLNGSLIVVTDLTPLEKPSL